MKTSIITIKGDTALNQVLVDHLGALAGDVAGVFGGDEIVVSVSSVVRNGRASRIVITPLNWCFNVSGGDLTVDPLDLEVSAYRWLWSYLRRLLPVHLYEYVYAGFSNRNRLQTRRSREKVTRHHV